jgi:hypothetical protein
MPAAPCGGKVSARPAARRLGEAGIAAGLQPADGTFSVGRPAAPVVTPEQAEIARLRAEVARLKMERDIAKKPRRPLRRMCCKGRLDRLDDEALADHTDVRSAGGQPERVAS